jgi:hypothetical protein
LQYELTNLYINLNANGTVSKQEANQKTQNSSTSTKY